MKPTNKEPLKLLFPELNSYQIAKLRQMLSDAKAESAEYKVEVKVV